MDLAKYPDFARDLIDISLKRWCVETNHWHIDRFFDQDQAAYENDDAAFCSTIITKFTMSVFNFAKRAYAAEELRYKGDIGRIRRATLTSPGRSSSSSNSTRSEKSEKRQLRVQPAHTTPFFIR